MVWSYSRVSSFMNCMYHFYLKYLVADDDLYLSEGNFYAEVGLFVHEIHEKLFKGEIDEYEALRYFVEEFDNNVFYDVKPSIRKNTFDACAEYFADLDLSWMDEYEILGVEKKINITLDGYKFVGYIDLLLRHKETGQIILMDHKSAKYPLKKDGTPAANYKKSFESYTKQMYLYASAVKEEYDVFPTWIVWNHFKDEKLVWVKFDDDVYRDSVQWFVDSIHQIEDEENFEPNISYFYCKNLCDFRNSCEYQES